MILRAKNLLSYASTQNWFESCKSFGFIRTLLISIGSKYVVIDSCRFKSNLWFVESYSVIKSKLF